MMGETDTKVKRIRLQDNLWMIVKSFPAFLAPKVRCSYGLQCWGGPTNPPHTPTLIYVRGSVAKDVGVSPTSMIDDLRAHNRDVP